MQTKEEHLWLETKSQMLEFSFKSLPETDRICAGSWRPRLYMASEAEMFLTAIYVDDILLAGKSMKRMNIVKQLFHRNS